MQDATFVVVAEYDTTTEAEIARSILCSAGIDAMIRNEFMTTIYPAGIPAQLVVRREEAERAQELLRLR